MKLLCNTEQEIIHVDGRELTISHPDKVFWPEEGFTKRDVMTYYQKIYPHIKPYLKDRPQCLRRNPDGIIDRGFFQKDVAGLAPEWGTTIGMYAPSAKKRVHYLVCHNLADLLFMVNLGCIELNPWHSHIGSLRKPDYCVLDLDPGRHTKFATVIAVALQLKTIADEVELPMYCKTSGSRGLHLYIPLGAQHTYVLSRQLAYKLASIAEHMHPELVTLERSLKKDRKIKYILIVRQIRSPKRRQQCTACAQGKARPYQHLCAGKSLKPILTLCYLIFGRFLTV